MIYSDQELERFRQVQKLAYRCVESVEAALRAGMTEKQAARMMRNWLSDHGVTEYFHVPFAWFGDRTSFTGFRGLRRFYPTSRRLEAGMPVILDVAPTVDGYAADIGYSCCLGDNPDLARLQRDLEQYRLLIPELVKARRPGKEIYAEVDRLIAEQGHENRHQVYPQRVLAHTVFRLEPSWFSRVNVGGFGLRAIRGLGRGIAAARRGMEHHWPLLNDEEASRVPVEPGLWAVEPHLGHGPVGAKWEEILVVTEDDAYWLDDDLPHVRRWARAS